MEDGSMEHENTPVEAAPIEPRPVPTFDTDGDTKRPEMNRQQESFYHRTFLPSLLDGNPVDVKGESGYGAVLLHQLLEERRTNPLEARRKLESLVAAYRGFDLPSHAEEALADFCFLEGNFAAGYAALGRWANPSHHLTLATHLGHPPLTAMQVLRWGEYGITRKGNKYLSEILDILQARLDDFQDAHGVSLVEDFWQRLTADGPVNDVAAHVEDEVVGRLTGEDVRDLLADARERNQVGKPPIAFQGFGPEYEEPIEWPAPWVSWGLHGALVFARLRILLRDAENVARDEAEIPRVGEGLVSEMTLLRQVQAALPGERVVHQARPWWLAPQSLDIFLPDYKIGIEYQGVQHSAPVEFFGGAKAFERQQDRDAQKQGLCAQYGCVLIEVHPGYQLDDVVDQVKDAIQQASGGPQ